MPSYSGLPKPILAVNYEEAAQAYLRSLPPEHFMEALGQSTQREITLASLALVRARRKDVQVFNELLVQYALRGPRKLGQVPWALREERVAGEPAGRRLAMDLRPAPPGRPVRRRGVDQEDRLSAQR